jgi:hypothetical protein
MGWMPGPGVVTRVVTPGLEFGHFPDWTSSHTSSHTSSICGEQHEEARMFSLDKLKVYDKALANAASLAHRSRSWDKSHAVTDQLLRRDKVEVFGRMLPERAVTTFNPVPLPDEVIRSNDVLALVGSVLHLANFMAEYT